MTLIEIRNFILKKHNISKKSLKSKCRIKELVQARIEFIHMAVAHNKSCTLIGDMIERDHSTIIYHKNRGTIAFAKNRCNKGKYRHE